MKVYNSKTTKNQDLFEESILIPVFTVGCTDDNLVNGYKGAAVYIHVSAQDEEEAIDKVLKHKTFLSHITKPKELKRRDLKAFKPIGNYVIGQVTYFEGDPRL